MTPEEIKATRERLGMTQQQFAKAIGCGYSTLARWEQREPGQEVPMLAPYAQALQRLKRKADRQEKVK